VNARFLGLASCVVIGSLGCGRSATTSTNITAPTSTRCQATVAPSVTAFGPAGGTGTLSIGVDRECPWRAVSPASWITFTSAVDGQGQGSVSYRVAENLDPLPREANVSVADRQVPLSQQPAPCRYTLGGIPSGFSERGAQAEID
jgi:hypothetical protein